MFNRYWLIATFINNFLLDDSDYLKVARNKQLCFRKYFSVVIFTFVPSSDGEQRFQFWIYIFEIGELLERPFAPVLLQVVVLVERLDDVPWLVQSGEPVNQMSAHERINVLETIRSSSHKLIL